MPIVDERTEQYRAGILAFCDCDLGQRAARFFADKAANPYGRQMAEEAAKRRRAYLEKIDGLKPPERTLLLDGYRTARHNRAAVEAFRAIVNAGAGMGTIYGAYGVGKTALLMAAVNECRRRDWTSMYTTVADLLGWLRAAFDPNVERDPEDQSFERRWALLVGCRCLALDELTAFSVTPWAAERFERLIDERWRNMGQTITLCAFNADDDERVGANLPGVVESRLRDRRAAWVGIGGTIDMRRVYRGDTDR